MNFSQIGEGYLTYLAAGGLILIGLYVVLTKDLTAGLAIITAGLGFAGQRRATANVQATMLKAESRECADRPQ